MQNYTLSKNVYEQHQDMCLLWMQLSSCTWFKGLCIASSAQVHRLILAIHKKPKENHNKSIDDDNCSDFTYRRFKKLTLEVKLVLKLEKFSVLDFSCYFKNGEKYFVYDKQMYY